MLYKAIYTYQWYKHNRYNCQHLVQHHCYEPAQNQDKIRATMQGQSQGLKLHVFN